MYFTRNAIVPASSNSVMQMKGQENVGISRNVVTGRNYGSPAIFTFTERRDMVVYKTLKRWLDSSVQNSDQGRDRNLRVNYYDDLKCNILVQKLENIDREFGEQLFNLDLSQQVVTGTWELINCIPLALEATALGYESSDSLMDFTLSVSFESYRFHENAGSVESDALRLALDAGVSVLNNII